MFFAAQLVHTANVSRKMRTRKQKGAKMPSALCVVWTAGDASTFELVVLLWRCWAVSQRCILERIAAAVRMGGESAGAETVSKWVARRHHAIVCAPRHLAGILSHFVPEPPTV